jgi:pimeloyl-ACP methyl ester carboxylesterase
VSVPARSSTVPGTAVPGLTYLGHLWGHPTPLGEGRLAAEYVQLRRDRLLAGEGVHPGGGRPVLLIPGFLASDLSLQVMRDWLQRCGYQAELPGILCNIDYSEAVVGRLVVRLVDMYAWHGRKVTLIGHSRGGMLATVVARRHPEMVRRVICLGSPLADPFDVHPLTVAAVRMAQVFNLLRHGRTAGVEMGFLGDLRAPVRVPVTSIYSRSDGIVYWKACLRPDVEAVEVEGSHLGLTVNRQVYAVLAGLLPGPTKRRGAA